jgi:hypothetical protein
MDQRRGEWEFFKAGYLIIVFDGSHSMSDDKIISEFQYDNVWSCELCSRKQKISLASDEDKKSLHIPDFF